MEFSGVRVFWSRNVSPSFGRGLTNLAGSPAGGSKANGYLDTKPDYSIPLFVVYASI